ncbi:MAG: RNA 2',3'-cyclic phosphodiesterase [Halobacteriovoraceae bacterium]|nr:RNA 2',3'-cyclic phosphodiesterase [Halobacteriovoraceae bacterium]
MESQKDKRLFIGIPVSIDALKQIKSYVVPFKQRYTNDRLVPSYQWHFTIAFLGEVDAEKEAKIIQALRERPLGKEFKCEIDSWGAFPSTESARVVWLGSKIKNDKFHALGEIIRTCLDEVEIEYDRKDLVFHMTLARMKIPRNLDPFIRKQKHIKNIQLKVDCIHLYQSYQNKTAYEIIDTIFLND